ncbi:PilZ domain-containing protein [Modestobacter sp. Leaf380]|uniref:PilZ domain-containing protein n=1 Tax=Modestobacter sp. Leaf380 TaxID=1736356 RepID=UPI0006FBA74B|nr:PilZ domain-containing protein [Modestobacter sp. Leaf380]KQS73768.1 hypothetical protein ASG41_04055 [Modestobacter sp. Leaf380]
MTDVQAPGLSRPESGGTVEVVVDGSTTLAHSTVESSLEQELVLEVGVDASGRRVRLSLGAEVSVWWSPTDVPVRCRPYQVADVRGGTVPTWRLRPLGPADDGDRRSSPRAPLHVPVGLAMPSGMLLGETADVSEGGLRAVFVAEPTVGFGDVVHPLPDAGERAMMAIVLDGTRVELRCRVVQRQRLADGRRTLRVAFEDLPDDVRARLRSATALEIGRRAARV